MLHALVPPSLPRCIRYPKVPLQLHFTGFPQLRYQVWNSFIGPVAHCLLWTRSAARGVLLYGFGKEMHDDSTWGHTRAVQLRTVAGVSPSTTFVMSERNAATNAKLFSHTRTDGHQPLSIRD